VLVVATGSTYPSPVRGDASSPSLQTTLAARKQQLLRAHADLLRAESVVIVGGGPVGVELAAEIVTADWPEGRVMVEEDAGGKGRGAGAGAGAGAGGPLRSGPPSVTVITMAPRLLEVLHPPLGAAAAEWLTSRGVRVVPNELIPGFSPFAAAPTGQGAGLRPGWQGGGQTITLSSGQTLRADYIFACIGVRPSSAFVKGSPCLAGAHVLPSGKVAVDAGLRVRRAAADPAAGVHPTLFALGDVALPPVREADVAHTAEKQAAAVVENVRRVAAARRRANASAGGVGAAAASAAAAGFASYPDDIPGKGASAAIYVVSLGPSFAVLQFNRATIAGWTAGQLAAGLLKRMLEVTKVWQMRGWWVGEAFWAVADWGAEFTSAYLLR
jgi:NADH dehydrogenase FAD-containing subunit